MHFSVVWNVSEDWIVLGDSTAGLLNVSRSSFEDLFTGIVLVVNGTVHNGTVMNNTEMADIYGTWDFEGSVTYTWKLLNDPCITIPGYADLDEKYGVLGQAVKFAGWLFFGIDDNGGLSPLDIGLDILSLVSGYALAERFSIASVNVITKLAGKGKTVQFLSRIGDNALSFIANPVKWSSKKVINQVLSSISGYSSSLDFAANFVKGYVSNNFRSLGRFISDKTYTGIYNNVKSTYNFITHGNLSDIVASIFGSNFNKVQQVSSTVSKLATKTVKAITNKVSSIKTATKNAVKKAVKTVKTTVKKVVKTVKKTTVSYVKRAVKTFKSFVKKLKFW